MSHYLFLNIPAAGHINPTLAIARELAARGERVSYLLPEGWRASIEAVGVSFVPLPEEATLARSEGNASRQSPDQRIALMPYAMALQSTRVIPALISQVEAIAPDYLLVNVLDIWGRLLARILGIYAIGFRPFHAPRALRDVASENESMHAVSVKADAELAQLMRVFGKAPISLRELRSTIENPTLVFMPKAFQFQSEAFDERFKFVGPSLLAPAPMPDDLAPWKHRAPLRAFISLGTLRNDEPAFYRTSFEAFEGDEWQVFLSVGQQVDPGALGPVPSNITVRSHLPQTRLLQEVDVFVTHAGLNSVMESLYYGVPMVALPTIAEQRLTANRIEELGLGVARDRGGLSAGALKDAAVFVARDPEIGQRVTAMQELTRNSGGFLRAVDAILALRAAPGPS